METTDLRQDHKGGVASATDRTELLMKAMRMVVDAAYGTKTMSEQEITQVLGELVRHKLLSADDSYTLRDRVLDNERINHSIDRRVKMALKRKGFANPSDLANRISRLENSAGA